jgi:hypothetical protein
MCIYTGILIYSMSTNATTTTTIIIIIIIVIKEGIVVLLKLACFNLIHLNNYQILLTPGRVRSIDQKHCNVLLSIMPNNINR